MRALQQRDERGLVFHVLDRFDFLLQIHFHLNFLRQRNMRYFAYSLWWRATWGWRDTTAGSLNQRRLRFESKIKQRADKKNLLKPTLDSSKKRHYVEFKKIRSRVKRKKVSLRSTFSMVLSNKLQYNWDLAHILIKTEIRVDSKWVEIICKVSVMTKLQ